MNTQPQFQRSGNLQESSPAVQTGVLQRKCACGNHTVAGGECSECGKQKNSLQVKPRQSESTFSGQRIPLLQPKLTVGASNDPLEHEADRISDQVVATPSNAAVSAVPPRVQRFSGQSNEQTDAAPVSVESVLAKSGRPMEPALRHDMEQRFGHDFSRVRVHTGAAAEQSVQEVNARAYTVGNNVVFGAGRFAPGTLEGQRLLAHELTHVVQQSPTEAAVIQRSPDDSKEKAEGQPETKFVGCDEDQQIMIRDAINEAEKLASRAVYALERDFQMGYEIKATSAHFGSLSSDQKSTIIERYKSIRANVGSKTYTCSKKPKKVKAGKEVVDLCGQALCSGSKITLFPDFGKAVCPAGPVILHEAAHNEGACDDIDKGKGYPPANPENNAYSYEYFAVDVSAGNKAPPDLKKRKPTAP